MDERRRDSRRTESRMMQLGKEPNQDQYAGYNRSGRQRMVEKGK